MIDHFASVAQKRPALGAELQIALNLIPTDTWYALPSGALTFLNERCSDYIGLPKDHPLRYGIDTEAAWDSHVLLLHLDDHEEARRVWSRCLRAGCSAEVSFRVRNAEGGYRWFLSRAEPVRAIDGTLLYWIGINLDIEVRQQAEFYLAEGQRLAHMGSWAKMRQVRITNETVSTKFVQAGGVGTTVSRRESPRAVFRAHPYGHPFHCPVKCGC